LDWFGWYIIVLRQFVPFRRTVTVVVIRIENDPETSGYRCIFIGNPPKVLKSGYEIDWKKNRKQRTTQGLICRQGAIHHTWEIKVNPIRCRNFHQTMILNQ